MYIFAKFFFSNFYKFKLSVRFSYFVVLSAISICLAKNAFSQTSRIEGVINSYARVSEIQTNQKTLRLADQSEQIFFDGDTVLIIQMTGVSQDGTSVNGAGRYEFNIIDGILGSDVTLTSPVAFDYNTGEIVQLVRVPSYKNAEIVGELTCLQWDRQNGTGGVLALMVDDVLTFNANIDVSGKGFRGAQASEGAFPRGLDLFVQFFASYSVLAASQFGEAGNKGEGAATLSHFNPSNSTIPENIRGWWCVANGGGGGVGQWSGGGGGANGGAGGAGGNQRLGSLGFHESRANNGTQIPYLPNNQLILNNQLIFMGGGGGAGTIINVSEGVGTPGGNGGGVVIIVANRLEFTPNTGIYARGQSVAGEARRAGAGGGGGGGSVLLAVNHYDDNNIIVDIRGGNGGDVNVEEDCRAAGARISSQGFGGGGGGGALLTSRNTNFLNNPSRFIFQNTGNNGKFVNMPTQGSGDCVYPSLFNISGGNGISLTEFRVHLNGFFHNYIFTPDTTVCHLDNETGTTVIRASTPKRENATFQWQWSTTGVGGWTDILDATSSNLSYNFTEEIYIRRVVTAEGVDDTSLPIKISVYEPIVNKIVQLDVSPEFCGATRMEIIEMGIAEIDPLSGGGGFIPEDYTVTWLMSVGTVGTWTEIDANGNEILLLDPDNITQYRFRRRVESIKGCVSEKGEIGNITVLPSIKNNIITVQNTLLCEGESVIMATEDASGGNNVINYQWKRHRIGNDVWENINYDQISVVENITGYVENIYRRDASSGACSSESETVMVRFYEKPQESSILTDSKTLNFLFTYNLEASPPSVGSGLWASDNEYLKFDPDNEPDTKVEDLVLGDNTIYWTVSNGVCVTDTASITLNVADVRIPGGFSPNGDGLNDCFRIGGGENATSVKVTIYDRYNSVVYENDKFVDSADLIDCIWQGDTTSGRELPSGTYFYQIILNGNKFYRGYVVLKR